MLTLTKTAGAHLTELLAGSPQDAVARIVRQKGRLKLKRGHEQDGDVTFAHEGRVVLSINSRMSEELSLRTLDIRYRKDARPKLSLKTVSNS